MEAKGAENKLTISQLLVPTTVGTGPQIKEDTKRALACVPSHFPAHLISPSNTSHCHMYFRADRPRQRDMSWPRPH